MQRAVGVLPCQGPQRDRCDVIQISVSRCPDSVTRSGDSDGMEYDFEADRDEETCLACMATCDC